MLRDQSPGEMQMDQPFPHDLGVFCMDITDRDNIDCISSTG